jgi:ribosomal protein S18 acetylase RimI-like enzyme
MTTTIVRYMCAGDVEEVAKLDQAIFPLNGLSVRQLRAELRDGNGLVAKLGDRTLGYCLLRKDSSLTELTRLAVADNARGMGVGKALLANALLEANGGTVSLQVDRENGAAFLLYFKSGFRIVGESGNTWVMQSRENQAPADCYLRV